MRIKIEVFAAPGCSRCARARVVLSALAEEIGAERIECREVDVLEELDYAVDLGVRSTPAIAIDGRLAFTGLPPKHKLRTEICRRLTAAGGAKHAG